MTFSIKKFTAKLTLKVIFSLNFLKFFLELRNKAKNNFQHYLTEQFYHCVTTHT